MTEMHVSESVKRVRAMSKQSFEQSRAIQMLANDCLFKHITVLEYRNAFAKAIADANEDVLVHLAHSLF